MKVLTPTFFPLPPEYWTIGKSVSSGCVRMINQDVVDLYGRVTSGARLIVI